MIDLSLILHELVKMAFLSPYHYERVLFTALWCVDEGIQK